MLDLKGFCAQNYVEREALARVDMPQATRSHTPIPHDFFVNKVQDKLEQVGLKVVNSAFALSKAGANLFGMFEIGSYADADYATVIGFRNSHIKKFAAGLVLGGGVFICDNLMFMGEIKAVRRHTTFILRDLGNMIEGAVQRVVHLNQFQDARFNAYKYSTLTSVEADHLIIDMLREGVINTSTVGKVVQQWDTPDHRQFTRTGNSAWRLYNATTEALKGTNIVELPSRTEKLTRLVDDQVGFSPVALAA